MGASQICLGHKNASTLPGTGQDRTVHTSALLGTGFAMQYSNPYLHCCLGQDSAFAPPECMHRNALRGHCISIVHFMGKKVVPFHILLRDSQCLGTTWNRKVPLRCVAEDST
jgi:hypothetical protein